MTRSQATELILAASKAKGLTWADIAGAVGGHKVWVASALLGQNSMDETQARKTAELLGLDDAVAEALQGCPMKGSLGTAIPVDPLIYRFHEITQVYGTAIKEIIHEMFGDGIMSAIDFKMSIERKEDPKGDRVVVTLDGKFLPYRKW